MLVAGVMTGNSLDAIDVVVADLKYAPPAIDYQVLLHQQTPLPPACRPLVEQLATGQASAVVYAQLEQRLSLAITQACQQAFHVQPFDLVGVHGQTIWHYPPPEPWPMTHQVFNPYPLVQTLGIPVVYDFRRADVAVRGQGAPLAPYGHYILFQQKLTKPGIILNLGGIANITYLPAHAEPTDVRAWDTGPAMLLLDAIMQQYFAQNYDDAGKIAATGQIRQELLDHFLAYPYFAKQPPKSTGKELFGDAFITAWFDYASRLQVLPKDQCATANAFVAATIANEIARLPDVSILIAAGGGAKNLTLIGHLQRLLPGVTFLTSTDFGIDVQALEALTFAILAYERWHWREGNLPSVTGAQRPVLLGAVVDM